MSHSMVIVLVEPSGVDVESELPRLMAPFDEQLDVGEHEVKCWCIGMEAMDEAHKALDEKMGTWAEARRAHRVKDELKERRQALYADLEKMKSDREKKKAKAKLDEFEADSQKTWLAEFSEPRQKFWHSVFDVNPKKDKPKADCDKCGGTGKHMSTSNDKATWDWYRIGGRWDGQMCGLPKIDDKEGGFNFGDEYQSLERNSCPVSEIKMDGTPFAVLTPDGEWHERGRLGWWAVVSDEKDKEDWVKEFRALLVRWKGCIAVSVDVHI